MQARSSAEAVAREYNRQWPMSASRIPSQRFEIAGKTDSGDYPFGRIFLSMAILNPSGTGLNDLRGER